MDVTTTEGTDPNQSDDRNEARTRSGQKRTKNKKKKRHKHYYVELSLFDVENRRVVAKLFNPHQIGEGAFGKTFSADLKVEGDTETRRVAVKVCRSSANVIEREIHLKLSHVNVVQLLYHGIIAAKLYLVLELMDANDLYDVVKRSEANRSLGIYVELYAYQMLRGLAYCHRHNIIHRDIKSENLLLVHERGILKIADFGCSALVVPGMIFAQNPLLHRSR